MKKRPGKAHFLKKKGNLDVLRNAGRLDPAVDWGHQLPAEGLTSAEANDGQGKNQRSQNRHRVNVGQSWKKLDHFSLENASFAYIKTR